jgi:hypothetical protein
MIEGEGQGGDAPQPTQSADEAPSWFREYTALVDKRFEGLAAKLSKAAPTSSTEPTATSAPQQSDVQDVMRSARTYGRLHGQLSEAQQAKLDALEEQGWGYDQLTAVAELLRTQRAPARESATATQVAPLGLAASAAPGGSVAHPATVSEYLELKSKNRAKWNALMADPSFDPTRLRRA